MSSHMKLYQIKRSPLINIKHMILFTICSTGFAIENETDTRSNPSIKCGTEKGQHKAKNHTTAGILKVNDYVYLPSDNHA